MTFQNFLSFVALTKVCLFAIPPSPFSTIQIRKHVRLAAHCYPLPFLPSICPVSVKFSNLYFLIMCSRNFFSLFLSKFFFSFHTPIFLETLSLVICSVQNILSILLLCCLEFLLSLWGDYPTFTSIGGGPTLDNCLVYFPMFVVKFSCSLILCWIFGSYLSLFRNASGIWYRIFCPLFKTFPRYLNFCTSLILSEILVSNLGWSSDWQRYIVF